ncbi:MAG: nucleoside deaminase [Chloroflexi bacterium]|nr:nucleoside deaminase [Chloroflexota bacterium]
MTADAAFMRLALEEAQAAVAEGNKPFGAVVVRGERVVARGHNLVHSGHDPTAHGEVVAIRNACQALKTEALEGATLYTTCEPCLMCTSAIAWAGIGRVVIGATWADVPGQFHPEKGSLLGMESHLSYPFEYTAGVLREECVRLYGESG